MKLEKHYTISQVCEQLEICDETIYRMIRARKITATKVGKDWRIPESSITAYLKSRTILAKAS